MSRRNLVRPNRAWALFPVLVIGVVATFVVLSEREPDTAFLFAQQHPPGERKRAVERIIAKASEPVPGKKRPAAVRSQCRQTSGSKFGATKWSCAVRYRSGHVLKYAVTVARTGALTGETLNGEVKGCCVPTVSG